MVNLVVSLDVEIPFQLEVSLVDSGKLGSQFGSRDSFPHFRIFQDFFSMVVIPLAC